MPKGKRSTKNQGLKSDQKLSFLQSLSFLPAEQQKRRLLARQLLQA